MLALGAAAAVAWKSRSLAVLRRAPGEAKAREVRSVLSEHARVGRFGASIDYDDREKRNNVILRAFTSDKPDKLSPRPEKAE